MSLTTVTLANTVKNQYFYKLKANIDSFSSLIGIQVLGIIFSLGGIGTISTGSNNFNINIQYYAADIVIVFTLIWAFSTAITITTKPHRNHDFTFVTNRLSSSLSNILFLITATIVGSITAILSGNVIQVLRYIFIDQQLYVLNTGIQELVIGISAIFLYGLIVCAIGYFIGTLIQVSKLFIIVIPVSLLGFIFLEATLLEGTIRDNYLSVIKIFQFYVSEPIFVLFIVKVLITSSLFFMAAISILNRMEVRK
ncbi:hypothetical protein V1503_23085 [Bacillus sp. SCS-151]|uniref:hypothetical protein n=1 Tax=Nanhaiella sioensis TaxID=3115293 RepID=UPI00397D6F3F